MQVHSIKSICLYFNQIIQIVKFLGDLNGEIEVCSSILGYPPLQRRLPEGMFLFIQC